jgi:hypothetical protein
MPVSAPPPGLIGYVEYDNSAAGANNDVDPGLPGIPARLYVTLPNGAANWTGMKASSDGQIVQIINGDAANTLTLNSQNAGSQSANQFLGPADIVLTPGDSAIAVYTKRTLNKWVLS